MPINWSNISSEEQENLKEFLQKEGFIDIKVTIDDDNLLEILTKPQNPDSSEAKGSNQYIISQDTAIHRAARLENKNIIKILLKLGVSINIKKQLNGATPLLVASQIGHLEVVRLLLTQKGIDVNAAKRRWMESSFCCSTER